MTKLNHEGLMTAVVEHSAEGICVCQAIPEHPFVRFSVWNRRMTEITGYTREQINALGWYQTVYPDAETSRRARARMEAMRDGEDLRLEEWRITRPDGQWRDLLISTSRLPAERGEPHVLGLMYDVTDRTRLREAGQRRSEILEAIQLSSRRFLGEGLDAEGTGQMLERLGRAADVCRAYLFEVQSGGGGEVLASQRFEWCSDRAEPQIDNPELQGVPLRAAGYARWVQELRERRVIAGPVSSFPPAERALLEEQEISSLLVAPVFNGSTWWGFLGFDACRGPRIWTEAETHALRAAADIYGAALLCRDAALAVEASRADLEDRVQRRTVELARSNEQLEQEVTERRAVQKELHRLTVTDDLTGLLNRRGFFMLGGQQLRSTQRVGRPLNVVMFDLNHLKRINDSGGHVAGDAALKELAEALTSCFRTSDVVARISGDEFAVTQIGTGDGTPDVSIARLRRQLATLEPVAGGLPISVAAGWSTSDELDPPTLEALLDMADRRMYADKRDQRS